MADHVRKAGHKEGDPMLACAYVKFDPVPKEWDDMVKAYEKWLKEEGHNAEAKFEDQRLSFIRQAAEVLTKDLAEQVHSPADYHVAVRDGSLVLEIFIVVPIIELISESVIDLLHMMASDEKLDKWEAAVAIGKFVAEVKLLDRQVRKIGTALNQIVQAVVGRIYAIRPESRVGVLSNFLKFHDYFSSAKIKTNSMKMRSNCMVEAVKQLEKIVVVLQKEMDKGIIYSYLRIRTRDLVELELSSDKKGNKSINAYNKGVKEIMRIKDDLAELNF